MKEGERSREGGRGRGVSEVVTEGGVGEGEGKRSRVWKRGRGREENVTTRHLDVKTSNNHARKLPLRQ